MSGVGVSGVHFLKLAGIYIFLFVLLLMNLVDVPFLGAEGGRLSLLLIGLYFWTVYRPPLLPYPLVFLAGLILDFLSGGLVGLYALCFMIMTMIVRGQRRFLLGQSWPVVWAGFCVAATVVIVFQFLAYSIAGDAVPPLGSMVYNLIVSSLLYPLILPLMMALNRVMSD